MNTATRLAGFGAALVVVLGAGWAVGAAVGPLRAGGHDHGYGPGFEHGGHHHGDEHNYGGLVTRDGYHLDVADLVPPAGTAPHVAFTTMVPTPAVYHCFFEVRNGTRMHLARFTMDTHDD